MCSALLGTPVTVHGHPGRFLNASILTCADCEANAGVCYVFIRLRRLNFDTHGISIAGERYWQRCHTVLFIHRASIFQKS